MICQYIRGNLKGGEQVKKADIGVALYVLAAFVMLIVPIPSWLLDILLAINIDRKSVV